MERLTYALLALVPITLTGFGYGTVLGYIAAIIGLVGIIGSWVVW